MQFIGPERLMQSMGYMLHDRSSTPGSSTASRPSLEPAAIPLNGAEILPKG